MPDVLSVIMSFLYNEPPSKTEQMKHDGYEQDALWRTAPLARRTHARRRRLIGDGAEEKRPGTGPQAQTAGRMEAVS